MLSKKHLILVFIAISLVCIGVLASNKILNTPTKTTTVSFIQVVDKYKKNTCNYLTVVNPSAKESREFELQLENDNAWNLVDTGEIYVTIYKFTSNNEVPLITSIRKPSINNK